MGSGYNQLCEFNFNLFCRRFELPPIPTHSALSLLTNAQYIDFSEEISTQSRVMILLEKQELYSLKLSDDIDKLFQLLLRTYTGLFADYVHINESLLASRLRMSEQSIYEALLALSRLHAIHYIPRKTTPYILYTTSRELPKHITLPKAVYEDQRDRLVNRIEAMKTFAFSNETCRVNTMLRYFGEKHENDCGKCDICRSHRRNKISTPSPSLQESILYLASQPGGHTIDYIINETSASRHIVIETIRHLLDTGVINIDDQQVVTIAVK